MRFFKHSFAAQITVAAIIVATAGTIVLGAGEANALSLGTNITKPDGITTKTYGGKTYNAVGTGTGGEDNEAEPGMVQSQAWDLEGFFLKGRQLSIVGGYNFYTGKDNMKSGDIFIDTNGDAVHSPDTIPGLDYNPGYKSVSNSQFKYDYVLDIDWLNGNFRIIKLDNNSTLMDTLYGANYNQASNPWVYVSNSGENVRYSGSFNTYGKSSQDIDGVSGWGGNNNHFAATFDLINEINLNGTLFHNTMECGNDNLIGVAPVPEPGTMMLLGLGILGLAVYGKRRMNREN